MKQIILSSKRVYRIWRPGWQVGTMYIVIFSFFIVIFLNGFNFEASSLPRPKMSIW